MRMLILATLALLALSGCKAEVTLTTPSAPPTSDIAAPATSKPDVSTSDEIKTFLPTECQAVGPVYSQQLEEDGLYCLIQYRPDSNMLEIFRSRNPLNMGQPVVTFCGDQIDFDVDDQDDLLHLADVHCFGGGQ